MVRWWRWGSIRRRSPPLGRVKKPAPGRMAFVELEIELTEGGEESLRQLAAETQQRFGLLAARLSKFERGLQTAGLSPPRASRVGLPARTPFVGMLRERAPAPGDPAIHLAYGRLARAVRGDDRPGAQGLGGSGPRRGAQDAGGHTPPPFRPPSLQEGAARLDPFVQRRVQVARGRSRWCAGPRRRQGEPPALPVRDPLRRMLRTSTTTSST